MADYENSGILFKNEDKGSNERAPDYTGKINFGGVEKRLAAWIKTGRTGKKFMSLKVSDPQERQAADPARQEPQKMATDDDDLGSEIPF